PADPANRYAFVVGRFALREWERDGRGRQELGPGGVPSRIFLRSARRRACVGEALRIARPERRGGSTVTTDGDLVTIQVEGTDVRASRPVGWQSAVVLVPEPIEGASIDGGARAAVVVGGRTADLREPYAARAGVGDDPGETRSCLVVG